MTACGGHYPVLVPRSKPWLPALPWHGAADTANTVSESFQTKHHRSMILAYVEGLRVSRPLGKAELGNQWHCLAE
jgi:hypothetical protein